MNIQIRVGSSGLAFNILRPGKAARVTLLNSQHLAAAGAGKEGFNVARGE